MTMTTITNNNETKTNMKVIVDTCVWSFTLRRRESTQDPMVAELKELISDSLVTMIGPIRQEILSGISSPNQFTQLQHYLSAFADTPLKSKDYELAAELHNICKKNGVQGSNTDFLICAVSIHHNTKIFTVDNDFTYFAKYIPIKL